MKRLLVQHWTGPIPEIVRLSNEAMVAYAARIGADCAFLRGHQFDARLTPPCQKLAMLSEDFDAYDVVTMMDADMFPVRGLTEDVFALSGFGIHHPEAHRRILRHLPGLSSPNSAFWGGAIYRLPLTLRKRLRAEYDYAEAKQFNARGNGEDEGIMHRLASRAVVLDSPSVYFRQEWAWPSYAATFTNAKCVHIRHHDGHGHKREKMAVYRDLQTLGIL